MEPVLVFFIWGGLFVLTVIAEIISQQLISIWFAAGSLAAFLAACFGASVPVQCIWFVAVSVLLLVLTRPIVRRIFRFGIKDTNCQEIGKIAVVIQPVEPEKSTGRVRLDGVDWIAVSSDGTPISAQTSVRVDAVDGTKLWVSRICEAEAAYTAAAAASATEE